MHVVEGGRGARDPLRRRLFRHAGGFARPSAAGQLRLRRLPLPGGARRQARLAQERLGGLPRRLLFPRHRRTLPIRPLGPRARASTPRCSASPRNSPTSRHVYFETPQPGSDAVTVYALLDGPSVAGAYRFVMRRADGGGHGHREARSSCARTSSRLGVAPADLHVLVLRDREADRRRLAARDPRFRRPGACGPARGERIWRPLNNPPRIMTSSLHRRATRSGFGLLPARPQLRSLSRRRLLRPPPLALDRAARRLGPGRRSSSSRSRPTTRSTTTSSPCGCRPSRPRAGSRLEFRYRMHWVGRRALPDAARPLRRDPPRQWRPGRHRAAEGRAQVHGRVHGRAARPAARRRHARAGALGLARRVFQRPAPRPCRTTCRATGGPSSTSPSTGTEPVEMRCYLRKGDEVLSETWLYQYHPT